MSEVQDTVKYGRLSSRERARMERQLGLNCDHGRICSGVKGEVEDEIVGWVEGLRLEFPSTYKSHATCRPHAVALAKSIMNIVGRRAAFKAKRKARQ